MAYDLSISAIPSIVTDSSPETTDTNFNRAFSGYWTMNKSSASLCTIFYLYKLLH